MKSPCAIAVVGSLNIGYTYLVDRLPHPGQTIMARDVETSMGGKGANQAIAAYKAGANVSLIGAVGDDPDGNRYLQRLFDAGIDTESISVLSDRAPTGTAFILVDQNGENCITINPGANAKLSPPLIDDQAGRIRQADALLLQLETPLETARYSATLAKQSDTLVILNPSPWTDGLDLDNWDVDVLVANEVETRALTRANDLSVERLRDWIQGRKMKTLIVTQGASETLLIRKNGVSQAIAPPNIRPVDTVGAGDSFAGFFACAIAEGRSMEDSVRLGNAAGALATQRYGAQAAIPTRQEILNFIKSPKAI